MQLPRLLLAGRSRLIRTGLRLSLGQASYALKDTPSLQAYARMRGSPPHLVLWRPAEPLDQLQDEIYVARGAWPREWPVKLILIANVANGSVARRLAALDLDAVLSDDISKEVLHRSLALVMLGERLFPHVRRTVPHTTKPGRDDVPAFPASLSAPESAQRVVLSSRESQILQHLTDGATNKMIARHLHVTEPTVKVHVKFLLQKIRATNRTQAAIWAMQDQPHVTDRLERRPSAKKFGS